MSKQSLFRLFICLQIAFLCSYAQLTFPASSIVIPGSGITLYFEYNTTNQTILMGLDMAKNVDYYAVGFGNKGNYGMHIFDIVAFLFDPTNASNVTVLDMYTAQNGKPPTDLSLNGTADYYLIDSYVVSGRSQVLFERKLNTGDPYDYIFDPSVTASTIVMNWAFNNVGERGLTFHLSNAGTVSSPMYNGFNGVATSYFLGFISPALAFTIHGYVLLFGWGILIEIALEFGRYKKSSNYYLKVHLYTTTLLYVLTALTSALGIYIKWGETLSGTLPISHAYMGFINMGLCTFQTFFGFLFNFKILKPVTTKLLPYLSKFHIGNGILIYLICKTLITTGVYLHWNQWMIYMYIYNGVIFGFRIFREVFHRVFRNIDGKTTLKIKGKDSQNEKHQLLMDLLNKNTPVSEILQSKEVLGLKWAILDNKVFDLKNITHPGGNFILNQINGREVGRFIYGSFGLESLTQETQHLHSKASITAVENNLIGTIMNTQHLLVPKILSTMDTFNVEHVSEKILSRPSLTKKKLNPAFATAASEDAIPEISGKNRENGNGDWILEKKTNLTPFIVKFDFVSNQYSINPLAKDIRHLGRHMKVSHRSLKKIRLYTLVLSQTESRIRRRQLLWDKNYKDPNTIVNSPNDNRSESLPLILKKYNNPNEKSLSSFLHEAQENTDGFIVEGPFGTGLDLTSDSTGVHCIFAAGTGILPFIDLFDYLLEGVLDPSSGNNVFKNGFKLHLFASFAELNDFIGLDICEKLAQACKDKGMGDAFKMVIRARDAKANELYTATKEVFDNAFVQKHADKECTRAYVCGPPVFNQQIPSGLNLIGIPKTRIIMV